MLFWSLGWEDPLEEEMATHFSILAGIISRTEETGGLQSKRSQRVRHDWTHTPDWGEAALLIPDLMHGLHLQFSGGNYSWRHMFTWKPASLTLGPPWRVLFSLLGISLLLNPSLCGPLQWTHKTAGAFCPAPSAGEDPSIWFTWPCLVLFCGKHWSMSELVPVFASSSHYLSNEVLITTFSLAGCPAWPPRNLSFWLGKEWSAQVSTQTLLGTNKRAGENVSGGNVSPFYPASE